LMGGGGSLLFDEDINFKTDNMLTLYTYKLILKSLMEIQIFKKYFSIIYNIFYYNKGIEKFIYFFLAHYWMIVKYFGISVKKKVSSGFCFQCHPSSSYSPLFYLKYSEHEDTSFLIRNSHLSQTFIDVGANIGSVTGYLFGQFKTMYLFEPSKRTFNALKASIDLNANSGVEFKVMQMGLSDENGFIDFVDEDDLSVVNRAVGMDDKEGQKVVKVEVCKLDNILPKDFNDCILKVDVEGYEEKVFLGSKKLFDKKKVKLVMFERLGRTNLTNIKFFFSSYDYKLFCINNDGQISTHEKDIDIPLINLFACPRELFPDLVV